MKETIKIAEDYFDYMARSYPVMCLSDEFYFFPRAKKAVKFLNSLDSLDEQKIKQDISFVKNLKSSLKKIEPTAIDLEEQIDLTILCQSMTTFLREFEEVKIWQIDPSIYLKIILLGIERILKKSSFLKADPVKNITRCLSQIPSLLHEAENNLRKVHFGYLEVALEMVGPSINYFKQISLSSKIQTPLIRKAMESIENFGRFLKSIIPKKTFIKNRRFLERILTESFHCKRSLEEIYDIARKEYQKTLQELAAVSKKINRQKSWQEVLAKHSVNIKNKKELIELYTNQIESLKGFLKEKNVVSIPRAQDIKVEPTPEFLKPVRASASYAAPITDNISEPANFYIAADCIKGAIHNEYIFVTAHETYPGHHLLDSIRRCLRNPIRQQIESPLFYEGWASYAERLIDDLRYTKNSAERLPVLRRQAWRSVRAMLDVGLRIGRLKLKDAENLLSGLGYNKNTVKMMARHYALTPGYQLCYTIGKFEIDRLKAKFVSKLGLKKFHDLILEGGEIPFEFIEKRIFRLSL